MAGKREKPEDIVTKLRQVEVLHGQGLSMADAVRQIGISQDTFYRWRHQGLGTTPAQPGSGCGVAPEGDRAPPGYSGASCSCMTKGFRPLVLPYVERRNRARLGALLVNDLLFAPVLPARQFLTGVPLVEPPDDLARPSIEDAFDCLRFQPFLSRHDFLSVFIDPRSAPSPRLRHHQREGERPLTPAEWRA